MINLEARLRAGEVWETRAKAILEKPQRTLDELEMASQTRMGVPIDPEIMDRLVSARSRGKGIERQLSAWLHPDLAVQKPRVSDALKMVQRGEKEYTIPGVKEMRRMLDFAVGL